jgi:hypothetical protein
MARHVLREDFYHRIYLLKGIIKPSTKSLRAAYMPPLQVKIYICAHLLNDSIALC